MLQQMKVFRGMLPDKDKLPKIGATGRTLGARPGYAEDEIDPEDALKPGDAVRPDIRISEEGIVRPSTGGMSVALPPLTNLRPHRRPPKHGGAKAGKKLEVYELETDELPEELHCRRDPYGFDVHAFIEPRWEMSFEEYQQALHNTRALWRIV